MFVTDEVCLAGNWTLQLASSPEGVDVPADVIDRSIPATVPGCVHTDLLAADLIEDPYLGSNEQATHWIGECDWLYRTQFDIEPELLQQERVDLAFDGLDTAATITLNGQILGRSENMHTRLRLDVGRLLTPTGNTLEVRFDSPIRYMLEMQKRVGDRPGVGAGANPRQLPHWMIRKMACNFGWDWGPQLVTAGIWRPVRIEAWSTARLGDLRPQVTQADPNLAKLKVVVDGEIDQHTSPSFKPTLRLILTDPDGELVAEQVDAWTPGGSNLLKIDRPQLWWPRGHGDQPLYELKLELIDADGSILDTASHRVGLRTVELDTRPDDEPVELQHLPNGLGQGERFTLRINNKPIFCKGANWIPDDCFPHRVTPSRYRQRIEQAADAHMNMLRVWGGGIYEDHALYEVCDELGIMVWQDFLFACACYPEEQPFWDLIEAEARDNVARLSRHCSLVLWNGCNENIWGTFDWSAFGDIRTAGKQTWGLNYYLKLLPNIVNELMPNTPYWAASPYSGSMDRHPNENEFGNRHIWDVWNGQGNYRNYFSHFPRFASEFGFQGPPNWPTLCRAVDEPDRDWLSPVMHQHNKQIEGQQKALDRIEEWFNLPGDFEDRWFLAQVNQARALQTGCEWFRALSPWCSGALYWQLNDCWPVVSWAAIDGDGRPKLLWYATKQFFKPRMLSLLPTSVTPIGDWPEAVAAYLHNDMDQPWSATLRLRLLSVEGIEIDSISQRFDVLARGNRRFELPADWQNAWRRSDRLIVAETDASDDPADRAWWFGSFDREIPFAAPAVSVQCQPDRKDPHRYRVTATADTLIRELCLFPDRLAPDARVDRQLVNLLPGEQVTFTVNCSKQLDTAAFCRPEVLRTVSGLVSQRSEELNVVEPTAI